jgi:ElaB/YqjD/DUF883 family membrane-anchored ribosome-binding protein
MTVAGTNGLFRAFSNVLLILNWIAAVEDPIMLPSNSAEAFAQSPQPSSGGSESVNPEKSALLELRQDLAAIVADLTKVVEHRAAQAKASAAEGAEAASHMIRAHPVAAVSVAVLLGAALAVALLPSSRPSPRRLGATNWSMPSMPNFVHAVQSIPSTVANVANSSAMASLGSVLERVIEQVAALDPKSPLPPTLAKAGKWFKDFRSTIGT